MEEKRVKIRVSGETFEGDNDQDAYSCDGYFRQKDGVWQVLYLEPKVDGVASAMNQLEFTSSWAKLHRRGLVGTEMEFTPGEVTHSTYSTPYGDLLIKVNTESVRCDVDEHGGLLTLNYHLLIEKNEPLNRVLKLEITEEEL